MDIPDLPSLEDIKELIDYWQGQVETLEDCMQKDGLNTENENLTPEQIELKEKDLEALKETKIARKEAIKKLSEAVPNSQNSSSVVGQKRPANSSEANPSKK